jgi:formyltetrahydrofolate hydrolase
MDADMELPELAEKVADDVINNDHIPVQHRKHAHDNIVRELIGATPHFVPQKINEGVNIYKDSTLNAEQRVISTDTNAESCDIPVTLSWLTEFKGS